MEQLDLFEDAKESAGADLSEILNLVAKRDDLQKEQAQLNDKMKEVQQLLRQIDEELLPDKMQGLKELKLDDGRKLKRDLIVKASLPSATALEREKDPMARAELEERMHNGLDWLRQHGHEGMITEEVKISAPKGHSVDAAQVASFARSLHLPVEQWTTVRPQTLTAWVKRALSSGEDVPMELFSVYTGNIVKITK